MNFIKNKRILALIGIIALILGTILPYFTLSLFGYTESLSLWRYWEGKVILILTVINTMFIFKDYIEKYIPQLFIKGLGRKIANFNNPKISLIPTMLIVAFVIYLTIRLNVASDYLKYGVGFYTLWIGIICLVGHALFYKKTDSMQNNFDLGINNQNNMQFNYQQPTNNQQQNCKYCPKCGNKVDQNVSTCFMCGHNF